jgi:hypothetical protein
MAACSKAIFVFTRTTGFDYGLLEKAARRLARETGFTRTEIEEMTLLEMAWWFMD